MSQPVQGVIVLVVYFAAIAWAIYGGDRDR